MPSSPLDLEVALRNARLPMTVRTFADYQQLAARAQFKGDVEAKRVIDRMNADPDFSPSSLPATEREARQRQNQREVEELVAAGHEHWRAWTIVRRRREEEEASS